MTLQQLINIIPLKRNKKLIVLADFKSIVALFVPAILFGVGIGWLAMADTRFRWLASPTQYPWELWTIVMAGTVATAGGVGDWLFHRLYVAAGPNERKAHLLALGSGGVPLAMLMATASVTPNPQWLLIPIIVVVLYTTVLICYDEFQFHTKRCISFETLMHRFLVFGNGVAWLAWMHWIYVRGGVHGML